MLARTRLSTRPRTLPVLVGALLALYPSIARSNGPPNTGAKDAIYMAIMHYDLDVSCTGSTRTSMDNMLAAWYNDLTDTRSAPRGHGSYAWDEDGYKEDGNRTDCEFADRSRKTWGDDCGGDNGDEPDALFLGTHGNHFSDSARWFGAMRDDISSCGGNGDCEASQWDLVLGNCDLAYLHLFSCHSMCRINWDTDYGDGEAEWMDSFNGVHQIDGFHGLSHTSLTYTGRCSGFSDDGYNMSIAEAWIDNQYSSGLTTHDDCPVAYAVGSSESDADGRLMSEQYNYQYWNPVPDYWAAIWIGDCDPADESALP